MRPDVDAPSFWDWRNIRYQVSVVALLVAIAAIGGVDLYKAWEAKPRPITREVHGLLPDHRFGYADPLELMFSKEDRQWHIFGAAPGKESKFSPSPKGDWIMKVENRGGKIIAARPPYCYRNTLGYFNKEQSVPSDYPVVQFANFTCR